MNLRVNWRASTSLVGSVLKYLSLPLVIPVFVAAAYGEDIVPFLSVIVLTLAVGVVLEQLDPDATTIEIEEPGEESTEAGE